MQRKLICLLQAVALVTAVRGQVPVEFSARIHAGDNYMHPIGHGLFFGVEQSDEGDWNFTIQPSKSVKPSLDVLESYTVCLQNPFMHGPLTQDLVAWRFARNADPGWAQQVPATEDVPFTTNAADQRYECANTDARYDTYQRAQAAGRDEDYRGLAHYKPRPVGHAKVVISSVTLKPGQTGQNAEFESVTLQVRVTFPKKKRRSAG